MNKLGCLILSIVVFCAGCATTVDQPAASDGKSAAQLRFQNPALDPRNGGRLVLSDHLQAGDILLSATNGVTSAGIRMFTLSPVSHAALYVGDNQVVEAVGKGVRKRTISDVMEEEDVVVVFRHPSLSNPQANRIRDFALQKVGKPYDHVGIVLQAPFSVERRVCELPLLPEALRNACIQGLATIQLGTSNNDRFFCSQLVLESYRQAGLPITDADPRWISPADILHMREGDVPAVKIHQPLMYVGHLKFTQSNTLAQTQ